MGKTSLATVWPLSMLIHEKVKGAALARQLLKDVPGVSEQQMDYIGAMFDKNNVEEKNDVRNMSLEEVEVLTPDVDSSVRVKLLMHARRRSGPNLALFLGGLATLIQLNTFLAGAVFVGLSVASPSSGSVTIQEPLQVVLTNSTGVIGSGSRRLLGGGSSGGSYDYIGCADAGADNKKGFMFQLQVASFCCFVASTGIATGMLMSINAEAELETKREILYIWGGYASVAFYMLVGLAIMFASLPLMAEVLFGAIGSSCGQIAELVRGIVIAIAGSSAVVGGLLFFFGFSIN